MLIYHQHLQKCHSTFFTFVYKNHNIAKQLKKKNKTHQTKKNPKPNREHQYLFQTSLTTQQGKAILCPREPGRTHALYRTGI